MKNNMGLGGAISVFIVAVIFFCYSLQYPYSSDFGPGPGFWPIWLSGLLGLLSLAYIYSVYQGKDDAEKVPDKKAGKEILFILFCMSLYVMLLPVLGFNISSALFLFVFLRKGYNLATSLGISAGAAVFLYVLFTECFATPLPTNMWGF